MRNAAALASKEARVWFSSPTAYVVSAAFLVICGRLQEAFPALARGGEERSVA